MKQTLFIYRADIKEIIVNDKRVDSTYHYVPERKNILGLTIKAHWRESSWDESYKIKELPYSILENKIVQNNVVYYKPCAHITMTNKSTYRVIYDTYDEALDFARQNIHKTGLLEIEID